MPELKTPHSLEMLFQHSPEAKGPLQMLRLLAHERLIERGLPQRNDPGYRYLRLASLFKNNYHLHTENSYQPPAFVKESPSLVFVNGSYIPALSCHIGLPKQLIILDLEEAAREFGSLIRNQWQEALATEQDPFSLLNRSLHRQGAWVYLPPKCQLETPIRIFHFLTQPSSLALPRLHLHLGAHAQGNFVLHQHQEGEGDGLVNRVTEVLCEEEAKASVIHFLHDLPPSMRIIETTRVSLRKNSRFEGVTITQGSESLLTNYAIHLTGEGANCSLSGLGLIRDQRESHTHVLMHHQAPHCQSNQLFQAILSDSSRSSFEGKIFVDQIAQKTEAFQRSHQLVLGPGAQARSLPNLEIYADDVKASHGATVGSLDEEQLFYLITRGLTPAIAQSLIVRGACEKIIPALPTVELKNFCRSWVESMQRVS